MRKKLLVIILALAIMATTIVALTGCNSYNGWINPYFQPPARGSFDEYTEEFFENNTLVFVCTETSSGMFPPFMSLSAVVPNEEGELVFAFSLNIPNGNFAWTADIGYVMVIAEIPNAALEKYTLGSVITVGGGWHNASEWLDSRLPYCHIK